jgi:hypothetical protein
MSDKLMTYNKSIQLKTLNNIYSGTGLSIATSDLYDKYLAAHTPSTGLIQFNLPPIAENLGKRYNFQNAGLGLTYLNSIDGANILFKGYSLSKLIMIKNLDRATFLATSFGWLVEDYYMCIESGWYNRSDYTAVNIGFANFDYDNQSDSSDRTGYKYVLNSGVTGLVLEDSAPSGTSGTYIVCFVTGTGLALNDEEVTFGDATTADVNEVSGDNKNQSHYITYNMGISFRDIQFSWYYSTDTTETNTYIPMDFEGANGAGGGYGEYLRGVDLNEFQLVTATNGFFIANDTLIDTEDHYVYVKVEISA